ncbi:hypothetical protein CKAH01_14500 [Colletotrichum kahawae]|uniref:Fungal N-terminal domain-containing protein n=1 Tax=Colletotrichum kahawae TaxID=34407 RepID=A0AAD9YNP6_COLKA|nr:hypothetical protein CKAH01_14500 [Colletotrichum kahawae]
MEAAASVVGLLSFAGQIINGLVKLSEFIQDHREADSRAENALRETQLLTSTVTKLRNVLQNLRDSRSAGTVRQLASHIVTLQTHLESCGRDLDEWVETQMSTGGSSSKRRKVDDFLSNRRDRVVRDLESKLSSHRAQISLSIGTLNISISHLGLEKLDRVQIDVQSLTESNLRFDATTQDFTRNAIADSNARHVELMDHMSASSEDQKIQAIMIQEETLNHMTRMSDSLSSIANVASSLQRIVESSPLRRSASGSEYSENQFCSEPSPLGGRKRKRHFSYVEKEHNVAIPHFCFPRASPEGQWSCGALIGIDQAFARVYKTFSVRCLFCDKPFHKNDFLSRARHLVDRHNFSGCDQSVLYTTAEELKDHLEIEHSASRAINRAMEALAKDVFSPYVSSQRLPSILYEAANLEQELIIQCNRPLPRRWATVPDCLLRASSPSQLHAMRSPETKATLRRSLHHLFWPVRPDLELKRYSQTCHECSNEANTYGLCKRHQEEALGSMYPRSTWNWFSLDHTLKVSAIFVKLKTWTTTVERIDLWMLDVLHKSDHLLAMFRCSAFCGSPTGASTGRESEKASSGCGPQFWGRQWKSDLLGAFDNNLVPHFHVSGEQSDGAVDSRDGDFEFFIPLRLKTALPEVARVA